jgi:hypothetical protein
LNRKLAGALAAFFSVSDILSVSHAVAEREKEKMGVEKSPHRGKAGFSAEEGGDDDPAAGGSDRVMALRRACVNDFIFGHGRDALAALLLDVTLQCLQMPDQVVVGKALRIFQFLCSEQQADKNTSEPFVKGWSDDRIGIYLGTSVFGTSLTLLVNDERLLALDFVTLLEDIFTRFEPLAYRINQSIASIDPNCVSARVNFSEAEVLSMPPCATLATFPGCSAEAVASLCSAMCAHKSKKLRKDALRDVISDVVRHAKGGGSQTQSAIMNLPFPTR